VIRARWVGGSHCDELGNDDSVPLRQRRRNHTANTVTDAAGNPRLAADSAGPGVISVPSGGWADAAPIGCPFLLPALTEAVRDPLVTRLWVEGPAWGFDSGPTALPGP
jgi:hypothetical protein